MDKKILGLTLALSFSATSQTADIYKSVTLGWSYNSPMEVTFNLYVGSSSNAFEKKFDAGTNLNVTVPVLANKKQFYAASAQDFLGNESDKSEVIYYTATNTFKLKTQYHLQRSDGLFLRMTYVTPTNLTSHMLVNTNIHDETSLIDIKNWQDLNIFSTDRYTIGGVSYTSVNVPITNTNNYAIVSYNDFLNFAKYNYSLFYSRDLKEWNYAKPVQYSVLDANSVKGVIPYSTNGMGFYKVVSQ